MEDASAPRALPVLQIRILGDRRESPAASEGPDLGRARNLKSTEEHYVLAMVSGEDERDSGPLRPRYLITVLAVMAVVWVVLFVVRVQAHQPNVDDYLYAYTAKSLYVSGDPFSAFLHTGQTSPLVPAMAALGADVRGIYGALAVELPLVLLLVAGNFVLARVWVSPVAAMVVALVAGLNIEVLNYAMLLNFAIASTAAVVWCFASYLRSNHLRDWRWALTFAIALSALALSRSMALVYVAPLALVVACDYLLDVRRNGHFWRWPALLALGSLLVLAGPWWMVSGHAALHYLLNAGYNPSSGYLTASQGFDLTLSGLHRRITYELTELGWSQSWVLGGAVVATAVVAALGRRRLNWRSLWMLSVWSVLTLLLLSTSSNFGTAFGLPVLVVVVVLCGSVLGQFPTTALRWALVPLAAVVAVGLAFQFTSSISEWWPGPTYRSQVINAGGTNRTNVGLITAQVARAVGKTPTVLGLSDPIVNVNGLGWELDGNISALLAPHSGQTATAAAVSYLPPRMPSSPERTCTHTSRHSRHLIQRSSSGQPWRMGIGPHGCGGWARPAAWSCGGAGLGDWRLTASHPRRPC